VANHTLKPLVDWQSQFIISGLSAIGTFILCLFFMKDLSPEIRDQLMVPPGTAPCRGQGTRRLHRRVQAATEHPWRQIVKWTS